jgi:hypothetical protein
MSYNWFNRGCSFASHKSSQEEFRWFGQLLQDSRKLRKRLHREWIDVDGWEELRIDQSAYSIAICILVWGSFRCGIQAISVNAKSR